MDDTRKYSIFPNNLDLRSAFSSLYTALEKGGYKENSETYCKEIGFTMKISNERTLRTHKAKEFLELLGKFPSPEYVITHCHWIKNKDDISLFLDVFRNEISATLRSDEMPVLGWMHDQIREIFQARNPEPKRESKSRFSLKPTIFVAHRFDVSGNTYSGNLVHFLKLLRYDVIEGEGYESRNIPDKVAERIKAQDNFICIVSEGDASWILSEIAFAKGLSKNVIILVEEDISFKKGILGDDYEHIPFPKGNLEKAFSKIVLALPAI